MIPGLSVPSRRVLTVICATVIAALLVPAFLGFGPLSSNDTMKLTLQFDEAANLFVGDKVTVLDVPVGQVTAIDPEADRVDVEVEVDADTPLPADAKAILVAPSLVSIRHVDLSPYTGGERLNAGATIPVARTASPVEWDQVKEQLSRFTEALGPQGANRDGALDRLLTVSAENLRGRGADMHATIESLSRALATLSEGGDDLFATVRNLQVFTSALDASQAEIVGFNRRFAKVAESLNADKDQLVGALNSLAKLFPQLQSFLKDNRRALIQGVTKLEGPAKYIADQRQNLADILQVAPGTLSNFYNILDPDIPGPTGTFALVNFSNIAEVVCATSFSMGGTPEQCRNLLEPLAKYLNLGAPPAGLIPLLRDGRDNVEPPPGTTGSSQSATSPSSSTSQAPVGGIGDLVSGLVGGGQ